MALTLLKLLLAAALALPFLLTALRSRSRRQARRWLLLMLGALWAGLLADPLQYGNRLVDQAVLGASCRF
ncbi:hypothetical protein [Azohydromonas caseinilytica]|uniref:Uncharacterized protein n=1 Tax=Azohydromonas caseinilytica TaxID=2728836 RepID=A0A848F5T9_9BURK|nr:hypothetical protein [Azohydromonas caseinilytica]NML14026.1 hypothetical protein [Azohydromonas caseinilytica]